LQYYLKTGAKPQQVKKLDPRAVPGIIVGYGPSTKQYRVMALHPGMKYKVYIVRHVVVNTSHFQEYFSRTAAPPVLQAFTSVHCMDVLNAVSVPVHATVALDVTKEEVSFVDAMALPTQALSQGSDRAVDEPNRSHPLSWKMMTMVRSWQMMPLRRSGKSLTLQWVS
jgi:hypothetical protein